jgi:hypothetical protein
LIYAWQIFCIRDSSKYQNPRKIANWGLWLIAIWLAVTYSLILRSAWTGLSIDCEDLQRQTLWLISHYIPSLWWDSRVLWIIQSFEKISSQTLGEILGTGAGWSGLLLDRYAIITQNENQTWGLLSSLIGYQEDFIKGVLSNQELIDAKICDFTLTHIKKVVEQSDIQLIWFVLITLLLAFFMRSIMIIMGIINFILLKILFATKWLTISKKKEECEIIDN